MKNLKHILMSDTPGAILRAMHQQDTLRDLEPTLADLDMEIPSGYHHKDNLEHSFRVMENAIERETEGPDLILRTAALFHDIGKPPTRKFGTQKSVSFDGHEAVGAKMMRRILPQHGYSKTEIRKISRLVAFHMRSHGSQNWTDSAVRRLIADVEDMTSLNQLVILFYADATTKDEKRLRKLHRKVDELVVEIARVKATDARKALRPALDGHAVMQMFNLPAGRTLGAIMKFLNSDEVVQLTATESAELIVCKFSDEILEAGGQIPELASS